MIFRIFSSNKIEKQQFIYFLILNFVRPLYSEHIIGLSQLNVYKNIYISENVYNSLSHKIFLLSDRKDYEN